MHNVIVRHHAHVPRVRVQAARRSPAVKSTTIHRHELARSQVGPGHFRRLRQNTRQSIEPVGAIEKNSPGRTRAVGRARAGLHKITTVFSASPVATLLAGHAAWPSRHLGRRCRPDGDPTRRLTPSLLRTAVRRCRHGGRPRLHGTTPTVRGRTTMETRCRTGPRVSRFPARLPTFNGACNPTASNLQVPTSMAAVASDPPDQPVNRGIGACEVRHSASSAECRRLRQDQAVPSRPPVVVGRCPKGACRHG